jgi:hypothetical protein
MVQSKVTPTIVAGVCDPGVDNCRPRRDRLQADNCRPRRDRLQAGPITACAMIPSVTQERVFLNHAATQVVGISQHVVGEAIGTRNRNELHLTHVDGFDGAKRARSGTHGADRDRDSAPDAGSRGRRDDQALPRRGIREIRRKCDTLRHFTTLPEAAGRADKPMAHWPLWRWGVAQAAMSQFFLGGGRSVEGGGVSMP